MGLFNFGKKKQEEVEEQVPQQPGNPTTMIMFRIIAIGYVLWILKDLVKAYMEGGPEAPSLALLIGSIVVLGGGCVLIGILSYKHWIRMKEELREYNEEVARQVAEEERLEAEKKALEEEYPDDAEYYEAEDAAEETADEEEAATEETE